MKEAKAWLSWHLFIECPYCKKDIDLVDLDEDGWISKPIFNNEWDKLTNQEVNCPQCLKTFKISTIEY